MGRFIARDHARSRLQVLALLCALGALATPAVANAAPATRLVYSRETGAEQCADEGALRSAVAARLGYDPFFPWAKTTLVASVRRDAGTYRAHIALVDAEGMVRGTRDLSDAHEDCAELLSAMALGISIALDMLDPRPPAPEPAPERPNATPPEPPPAPVPAPPASAARNQEAAPAALPPPPELRVEAGIDLLAALGVLPAAGTGVDAFVRVRDAWWSVGVEGAFDAPTSKRDSSGRDVSAYGLGGAVVPCAHVGPLDAVALCGVAALGFLHAQASAGTGTGTGAGAAAVASLGLRIAGELPLSGRLAARLHADGLVPLARTTLRIDGEDLWKAPAVDARFGLGLVYRF